MAQQENEFDSEYCNVKYIEKDNVVLLVWKKFCSFEDYRQPTMYAANLLHKHKSRNFVIDARNGFEDEKADVEWGFSVLLPYIAKSDCKICVFIMSEISNIDDEIDLWSKEFMRYFEVKKVLTYEDAVGLVQGRTQKGNMENKIKQMIFSYGADVCGISGIEQFATAPTSFSPKDIFEDCKSVIAFGKALPKGLTSVDSRHIYGHYNTFICNKVDEISLQGAKNLEEQFGAIAVPMPCDAPYEYWESETQTGKGLISMKHTAVLCGLGRLGKSSLLINPKYGTLLTVGAILTNLELSSDELCEKICINGCTKCVDACSVGAIRDGKVNQLLCRQNTYGKTARGFDTVDCNRCRTICPMRFGR